MNLDTLRIIRQAADMLGSYQALANLLRVTPEEMKKWFSGEKAPADGTLFVVLAILHGATKLDVGVDVVKKKGPFGPLF